MSKIKSKEPETSETIWEKIKKDRMTKLKEYYKYIYKCNICKLEYGSMFKKDDNICPRCAVRNSRFSRKGEGGKTP